MGNNNDEEDDDVSLLATQCEPMADEEDEIDDETLLAAEMLPEFEAGMSQFRGACQSGACVAPGCEQNDEDYLEGLTAEMFEDDDDFDGGCNQEEDVEPLPDAHFGLLGCSRVLLQPQSCMDDLPEEVLRQILCLLPAADLYRNASLVCHCWRNIVQDPKVRRH